MPYESLLFNAHVASDELASILLQTLTLVITRAVNVVSRSRLGWIVKTSTIPSTASTRVIRNQEVRAISQCRTKSHLRVNTQVISPNGESGVDGQQRETEGETEGRRD